MVVRAECNARPKPASRSNEAGTRGGRRPATSLSRWEVKDGEALTMAW